MLCKIRSQDEEKVLSDFDRCFLILFCMVMSVTVNAAQKTPGRVKMVSAYSDPDVNQVHVTWDKTTNYSQMDYPSQNEYSRG